MFHKSPPTDRVILRKIHERYVEKFGDFDRHDPTKERETKIFVPIDCEAIASELGVDPDIVFGRLYYHLNNKYGYTDPNGNRTSLFVFSLKTDRHAVHFPLLSAILADMEQSWFRFAFPTMLAGFALIISVLSAVC